jgi:hypothetical protein
VFERFAVDAIESTVSLFEIFAREQFSQRVPDASSTRRARATSSSVSTTPPRCSPSMPMLTSSSSRARSRGSG